MQLAIDGKSEPNMLQIVVNISCRIYPTFWYAATSSASVQWRWWIPTNIYPTSSARYNSFMIIIAIIPHSYQIRLCDIQWNEQQRVCLLVYLVNMHIINLFLLCGSFHLIWLFIKGVVLATNCSPIL